MTATPKEVSDMKAELRAAIAKEHESAAEHTWATDEHYDIVNTLAPALLDRLDELETENAKLRAAIRRAGFAVMETSGDWSIHDVSEHGKAEEERTAEIISRNVELEAEFERFTDEMLAVGRIIAKTHRGDPDLEHNLSTAHAKILVAVKKHSAKRENRS